MKRQRLVLKLVFQFPDHLNYLQCAPLSSYGEFLKIAVTLEDCKGKKAGS